MTTATCQEKCNATPRGEEAVLVAFELGAKKWVVGVTTTDATRTPLVREVAACDLAAVLRVLDQARARWRLPATTPIASCYEAGRDAFWLHRWLEAHGIENVVVDASSIEVPRRRRRRKSDGMDVRALLRLLARARRGEPRVWSVVRIPSVAAEDARQLERELVATIADRTRLRNRIQGLLAAQGARAAITRNLTANLAAVRTATGSSLSPGLQDRVTRELAALTAVEARLRELRALQRRRVVPGSVCARLQRLRGVALTGASRLSREVFDWRQFTSGRQVGALMGMTPTPYDSGEQRREQGISKAGNRRIRTLMTELAQCWRQFQPSSGLTRWYQHRFGQGPARLRRIGLVALARKLLIALWRYVERGELPEGAVLKVATR